MEQNTSTPMGELIQIITLAAEKGALKKVTLSKPTDKTLIRAVLTVKRIGDRRMFQLERFLADNKATHKNFPLDDEDTLSPLLEGFGQVNVITTAGDCERKRSKSGTETLLGSKKLLTALSAGAVEAIPNKKNDHEKSYILSGDEPFLKLLGVSDKNGRVYDKKRAKFRQINRFLEHIRDVSKHLPKEGTLYVCDLCCGKSYLSFAAYHYLRVILKRDVVMRGVDLKPDVIQYCNDVCEMLGFDTLEFLCGDIGKYTPEFSPSLVISLHACDTATDLVLENAMRWGAKVILSTPCCHHELNHTINCPAIAFVTEHSMLRQKLCDAATDALRLKLLEANGYAVDALELIDPEETPKNIMLRAIKKNDGTTPAAKRAMEEYLAARAFLLGGGAI